MTAVALVALYRQKGLTLTTAESCTGGLVAAAITAIPGASSIFTHGFVTYANQAKTQLLGVPEPLLAAHGAVSAPVAAAMAQGARQAAGADVGVAITGIAGPDGGSPEKPVGTVWFGLASKTGTHTIRQCFPGDRDHIREAAKDFALTLLADAAA